MIYVKSVIITGILYRRKYNNGNNKNERREEEKKNCVANAGNVAQKIGRYARVK